jgi:hypothetical protein
MSTTPNEPQPDQPGQSGDEASFPKTTRPEAAERREPEPVLSAAERIGRKLDAVPDRVDARDFVYHARLSALPDQLVNCAAVPEILDQGNEGACTGFALAAVINFLLRARGLGDRRVSPRMLYEMARRYDEWPGEDYDGSSARGGMKGWVRHGVCTRPTWPDDAHGAGSFTQDIAREAQTTPGGAFYRVLHRDIRDMHAALAEVGILYVTLMVHDGWGEPGPLRRTIQYADAFGNQRSLDLPVIQRRGRADSGHAVAIVGYTTEGFIIQNSWGEGWGQGGFALLPYEDYMLHATDVWVAQLGVPVTIELWRQGATDTTEGLQRATPAIPLSDIRPYVVDVGNNGELSATGEYWTTEEDLRRLFTEDIPRTTSGWSRKRVLLYLHGGLNEERAVARRIVSFRDVLLANEIYPLHIMWETGFVETLNHLIQDYFTDVDERAGDWLRQFREGLLEARDRTLELTVASKGTELWREMKENARLASAHPDGRGGMQLLLRYAQEAIAQLDDATRQAWELHVVGHSAGCIYAAHALPHVCSLGVNFKTVQLMAPAIRVDEFKRHFLPPIRDGVCPLPTLYMLSDVGERDDQVGPYGKSLLYLVSNAFEGRRETPLLGMETYFLRDPELRHLYFLGDDGLPSLVVAGVEGGPGALSRSNTHGGFDNDPDTLNSVVFRILGQDPRRPFTTRDLQY